MLLMSSRKATSPLLAAGLLWIISGQGTANLLAQNPGGHVPVGRPTQVEPQHMTMPGVRLGAVRPSASVNGGVHIGQSFDGVDFNGSNCFCLPPDTNAAVSTNFVVEAVNLQFRVFDKAGNVLLDEPLDALFGVPTFSDPYVVYDDNADRWYVSVLSNFDPVSGEWEISLAVSSDNNPLHAFQTYNLTNTFGFPDYPKLGFNKDAIFVSYNDFATTAAATIASVDKAAALAGTLTYYISVPEFQFRALPPAQMHHDTKGGVEWFVSTDGTDAGGNTIRVTQMTNYLSNAPVFTYTSLPVTQYSNAIQADQPGGPGSVTTFPNTTTTQVQYHNGHLSTAMASAVATDGFIYPKGLYFYIDVNGQGVVKPRLIKQGVIDPGFGVAVQMPSVDEDQQGNLGFTWMESSNTEYVSMWVGNLYTNGQFTASVAAPGVGFFEFPFRIGDYSSIVLDPADGKTFWAANEYADDGPAGPPFGLPDIWRTHITSFKAR